ncbi:AAA family ATPase [Limnobacter profundi]|jgi:predicted kinase|uniref:ATP-binding protein n=1 Tax=Limnobacter profundi TaxID=2732163 RepID=A0ABX6N7G8_9BURK|nr:ATP-binding protein [Limnobacter sp. SAORIC-580]MBA4316630.1 cell division protein ZipA [Alcaligenaceae bacterium]QJR29976.1 ATP-binding protein [Limnobacter sp. SAORIC-580]
MTNKGRLTFFCGKMGAGKSTLARRLADQSNSLLLSEDQWLAALYPDSIHSLNDYVRLSRRLKSVLRSQVVSLLRMGVNVVMDFPGNTRTQRQWFREVIDEAGCPHELVYLDRPDSVCIEQLSKRRELEPERAKFDTERTFYAITAYFQAPEDNEGFKITIH